VRLLGAIIWSGGRVRRSAAKAASLTSISTMDRIGGRRAELVHQPTEDAALSDMRSGCS
jgi:hypothetical protein